MECGDRPRSDVGVAAGCFCMILQLCDGMTVMILLYFYLTRDELEMSFGKLAKQILIGMDIDFHYMSIHPIRIRLFRSSINPSIDMFYVGSSFLSSSYSLSLYLTFNDCIRKLSAAIHISFHFIPDHIHLKTSPLRFCETLSSRNNLCTEILYMLAASNSRCVYICTVCICDFY